MWEHIVKRNRQLLEVWSATNSGIIKEKMDSWRFWSSGFGEIYIQDLRSPLVWFENTVQWSNIAEIFQLNRSWFPHKHAYEAVFSTIRK